MLALSTSDVDATARGEAVVVKYQRISHRLVVILAERYGILHAQRAGGVFVSLLKSGGGGVEPVRFAFPNATPGAAEIVPSLHLFPSFRRYRRAAPRLPNQPVGIDSVEVYPVPSPTAADVPPALPFQMSNLLVSGQVGAKMCDDFRYRPLVYILAAMQPEDGQPQTVGGVFGGKSNAVSLHIIAPRRFDFPPRRRQFVLRAQREGVDMFLNGARQSSAPSALRFRRPLSRPPSSPCARPSRTR